MIELNVRNFCKNCRWFNPETTTLFVNDEPHTYVSCIYEEQCVRVAEMAKEQEREEREELPGQMCLFDPPEVDRLRRDHLLSDPAKYVQVYADDLRAMPDGTEIIVVRQGRDYKSGAYKPELNHYYRAVTWIVQTRYGGHDVRLVSEPDEEWPERPPWISMGERGQWVLPHWIDLYYVRKEQET